MKRLPFEKYRAYPKINNEDRKWPDNYIEKAPIWCSVDLRDGNQALINPMRVPEKLRFFRLLLEIGFKEIEIGFPAASETELEFCRALVDQKMIPDDVFVQVLCQCREPLIDQTFIALKGVKKAIFHLYNSTSKLQRDVVFRASRQEIVDIALKGTRRVKELLKKNEFEDFIFQYSPESYTGTEPDFALDICHAVTEEWGATPENKIILNLPATVEMSTPNVHADLIETFIRDFKYRDSAIISLHPHNDRGCAVAATELGLMAGADRVEGTLMGNGERTGNVDIITLAMNLYSQGIDPCLKLAETEKVKKTVEDLTEIKTHPRHPYMGELVFTAFSGSHQDAIKKGFQAQKASKSKIWEVPYLPIDPEDLGRTYEAVIRINSQSGKGGAAYVMDEYFGFRLPRDIEIDFGRAVKAYSDKKGKEVTNIEINALFKKEYQDFDLPLALSDYTMSSEDDTTRGEFNITVNGKKKHLTGSGNGPLDALANSLRENFNAEFDILDYREHSLGDGSNAKAVCYITIRNGNEKSTHSIGIHTNTVTASLQSLLRALNKAGVVS